MRILNFWKSECKTLQTREWLFTKKAGVGLKTYPI